MRNKIAAFAAVLALSCPALATVLGNPPPAVYACTGAVTVYTIPFPYLATSQVVAVQTNAAGIATTVFGTVKPSIAPTSGTLTLPVACPAGSTLTVSRSVPLTQPTSFRTGSYSGPVHEQAFDRLEMQIQQLSAKEITDIGVVNNTVAAFNASGAAVSSLSSVLATSSTTPRTLAAWLADVANVKAFGAKGDGTTDDTAAIQAALNTGKDVVCPVGDPTYKISNSLFMQTTGQTFSGACTITMDASLAKPALWLGATDATGTDNGVGILNAKVRGVRFIGTGTKTLGSAGIAFKRATTVTLDSIQSWGFYAGIDVRGWALVNSVINADLRQNVVGFNDRTDVGTSTTIDFQGSTIFGGRFEQNVKEGLVLGSSDVRVVGTVFEGNSNIPLGGTGTDAEIRITPGFNNGSVDLADLYMEILGGNTTVAMIQVDAASNKHLTISGGNYYGNDATNRCIIRTQSVGTIQAYAILGGTFTNFKNYICGAINSAGMATILPAYADASRDASADLSATTGAVIFQRDRILGAKTNMPWTSDVASTFNAVKFNNNGARLKLGGGATDYLYSDGTNVKSDGNLIASGFRLNGGNYGNNGAASSTLQGAIVSTGSAVATKMINTNALAAGDTITGFYSDNGSTLKGAVLGDGAMRHVGVTQANLGTPVNGVVQFCSDCTSPSSPCTSGGTGALAVRQAGAWKCF